MKIQKSTITKYVLTELDRPDPVTVIMEDLPYGAAKLTIDCAWKAWTGCWSSPGKDGLAAFLNRQDVFSISSCLFVGERQIIDCDTISEEIGAQVDVLSLNFYKDEMIEVYGSDWMDSLPTKTNPDYRHLCRIVKAVKELAKTIVDDLTDNPLTE